MIRLPLAIATLLLLPQQAAPPVGPAADTRPATIYRDPGLGFSYQYPGDFEVVPQLADALVRGMNAPSEEPERKCISFPLAVGKNLITGGADDIGFIVMVRVDRTCMGDSDSPEWLGAEAQQMATNILQPFGKALTEDAVHYKLAGHDAAFVQGSAEAKVLGDGRMLHSASICTLVTTNTLCWVIVDSNHKAMSALVANPVTFAGRAGEPLVPKDLVQRW